MNKPSANIAKDNTRSLTAIPANVEAEAAFLGLALSDPSFLAFAPAVFATMGESNRIGKARLEAAMDRLFRDGRIERAELWKGPDRKPVFGLRETAGNGAGDTVR